MQKEELVIAAWLLIIKYLQHFIYPLRRYFKFNIKYTLRYGGTGLLLYWLFPSLYCEKLEGVNLEIDDFQL